MQKEIDCHQHKKKGIGGLKNKMEQLTSGQVFFETIQILIPNIITLGIVSKMISTELKKKKNEIYLRQLEEVLKVVATASREPSEENNKIVLHKVLELGSEKSIIIATELKKRGMTITNFEQLDYEFIAYYPILFCQIKFELSGIKVNPLSWYLLAISGEFLTDAEIAKYKNANNKIVTELKLDKFLLIG